MMFLELGLLIANVVGIIGMLALVRFDNQQSKGMK